ncbi:MAG: hypothetical protein K5893_07925 [Prevotella sp.]|nr:hypothetical protein [Prevotella sp.]
MKKVFIFLVLTLAFVGKVQGGTDYVYFGPNHDNVVHNIVMNRSNAEEIQEVTCYFGYYNNGTDLTNIYSDYRFKAEIIGDLVLTDDSEIKTEYKQFTSAPKIRFKGRGGAILVWAEGYTGLAVGWQTYFVITAPYVGNQAWDFFTNANLNIKNETLPHWKEATKFSGHPERPIKVVDTNFDQDDAYRNDSHDVISGTNARYIPETAGLIFDVPDEMFGINDNTKTNSDGNPYRPKNYVVLGGYGKLTIPHVKAGSFIKIWCDAMDSGQYGANYSATNLRDLDNNLIVNQFSFTGATDYDKLSGCLIFKVDGNDGEYKDVSLKLQDKGYTDIYRIEVIDTYNTDMILYQCQDMGDGWKTGGEVLYNNEYGTIVHDGINKQERYYNGTPGVAVLQRGRTCDFDVETTGSVQVTYQTEIATSSNGKASYNYLHLTDISGTGNIRITQKEKFGGYVLNKKETWIAVGEYTKQDYPHTWDFTDYNIGKGELVTRWLGNWSDNSIYGYWNTLTAQAYYGLKTYASVDANAMGTPVAGTNLWTTTKIDKPLFAQGAQLTHSVYVINETKGLRVKQLAGSFSNGKDKYAVGTDCDNEIKIDGNKLIYNRTANDHKLLLTIPNVDAGMFVFVEANKAPTVKCAGNTLSPITTHAPKDGVYEYSVGSTADVELLFSENTEIKKIGVTNIEKNINVLGYATESRNHDIDHTYTGLFTNNDVNAYAITTYDGEAYDYKGYPEVKKSENEVTVVPKNTGIVLYDAAKKASTVPLFYPACNVGPTEQDNATLANNWMAPWVKGGKHYTETIAKDFAMHHDDEDANDHVGQGEECTKFIMTRKYYTYNSTTGTSSEQQTSEVEAFFRMKAKEGGSEMAPNKAYLLIPTSKLPKALWNGGNGEGTAQDSKNGIIFIDLEDIDSDIEGFATSIGQSVVKESDCIYYTVAGVRIEGTPTQKGVYVRNGKKFFIK